MRPRSLPPLLYGVFLLVLSGCLWRGREIPFKFTDQWIYGVDKGVRTLAFLEFENLGGANDKSFDAFKKTIPLALAAKLRYRPTLSLPVADYIPVIKNLSAYKTQAFPSTALTSSNYLYTLTNGRLAYLLTNQDQSVTTYSFKTKASDYLDAQLLEPQVKVALPVRTNKQKVRYFYDPIPGERRPVRLALNPRLYALGKDTPLWKVFSKINFDYLVYGAFKVEGLFLSLHLFVINQHEKSVTQVYSTRFKSIHLKRNLQTLEVPLVAFLEQKEIVGQLTFNDAGSNSLLYLNNTLVGRLPTRLDRLVAGDYRYQVWKPGQELTSVRSDYPLALQEKTVLLDRSNGAVDFIFSKKRQEGNLKVAVRNDIGASLYLNNTLVAVNETYYQEKLLPGQYFFQAQRSNYQPRRFEVKVNSGETTELSFLMKEQQPTSIWSRIFLNYSLNVKIFATLGFILGSATVINQIQALDYEDKKNEAKKRLETLKGQGKDFTAMDDYHEEVRRKYNDSVRVSVGLLSGTLLSFLSLTVFHFLDIWEDRAVIETEINPAGDVKIRYQKTLDF